MMHDPSPLSIASQVAREAGAFLLQHRGDEEMVVDEQLAYDIKLELDRKAQDLISDLLLTAFPDHAFFGEEGIAGDQDSPYQWVVDPIDGTVNYFYGIPHFCVSIALRHCGELQLGVIYDPMLDELFAIHKPAGATLNGRPIRPSTRSRLSDTVVTVGFSKSADSIEAGLARYGTIARSVKKTRMLGSAALAMAYIACGRLDAYIEEEISLWDIAAGKLLVEAGGGVVELTDSTSAPGKQRIIASNGHIHQALLALS
jgi:myo-inositol-1(or 4)-monophosphatase